ncbi:TetR/AcrR family transcriptional regulator [Pseudomonas chlororaphis]|uniref:TetR/AcrR family transcriptional regulator n=1 Tax=Pseudomonas chlororaphis TaxID=587753 RepID=UPI000F574C06|nr:TetR/AcrR family transcriptional regulator [Pseudomonas chlororaphis]
MKSISPLAQSPKRAPGRPREFDANNALDKAADIFSERGFAATSIDELAKIMGLVTGSLYRAFKDKRTVFTSALERYLYVRSRPIEAIVASPKSGKEKITDLVELYSSVSYGSLGRRGCLVVSGAVELAAEDDDIRDALRKSFEVTEQMLCGLIDEGKNDGSIRALLATQPTARAILCFLQGIRVVGKVETERGRVDDASRGILALLS